MSPPQFHETPIGQTFLAGTMPALVRELQQLNGSLEKMNNPSMELRAGKLVPVENKHPLDPIATGDPLEDKRKLGAILAGLRMLQRGHRSGKVGADIMGIATNDYQQEILATAEIDDLCIELNE